MKNEIRVIAAVVDLEKLTLFKENGDTVFIYQGDHRLAPILEQIKPVIAKGGIATVDLNMETAVSEENAFNQFEKKTNGLTRFFKVAKEAVKKFFSGDEPAPAVPCQTLGEVNQEADDENYALAAIEPSAPVTGDVLDDAINEVLANAVPASNVNFQIMPSEEDTHEVIAVVTQDDGKQVVIPEAEKLHVQVTDAVKRDNTIGVQALMNRLAAMPKARRHSVQDLLKFIERADLPITDKGDIIIYKILNGSDVHPELKFVDVHTHRVTQGPGALVVMDESLVDMDRSNECSNGLHIARRGYLSSFSGSACFLGLLRPEDVIAVPHGDRNKMRVCAYHLVFQLSAQDKSQVCSDRPLAATSEAAMNVAKLISGNYPEPQWEVRITGPKGGGVIVTKRKGKEAVADAPIPDAIGSLSLDTDPVPEADKINPVEVAQEVAEIKAASDDAPKADETKALAELAQLAKSDVDAGRTSTVEETKAKLAEARKPASPREKILDLLTAGDLNAETAKQIYLVKKAAKKGWDKLGVDKATEEKILALLPQDK